MVSPVEMIGGFLDLELSEIRMEQIERRPIGGLWPVRLLILLALAVAVLALLAEPSSAVADEAVGLAQQFPYGPPEADIDLFSGVTPLAGLSLWAQASIVSAIALGTFFFIPPAVGSLIKSVRSNGKGF